MVKTIFSKRNLAFVALLGLAIGYYTLVQFNLREVYYWSSVLILGQAYFCILASNLGQLGPMTKSGDKE